MVDEAPDAISVQCVLPERWMRRTKLVAFSCHSYLGSNSA